MKKHYQIVIALITIILSSCNSNQSPLVGGSNQSPIVGKWKYLDAYDLETKRHPEDAAMWYGRNTFYFNEDNHYKIYTGTNEEGTWKYDEKSRIIHLISDDKEEKNLRVIELSKNKLTIEVGPLGIGFGALVLQK